MGFVRKGLTREMVASQRHRQTVAHLFRDATIFGSSRNRVGDTRPLGLRRALFSRGGTPFLRGGELVTMSGWAKPGDSMMSTVSLASSPWLECMASSVTRRPWSSRSAGAEKNALRGVWAGVSRPSTISGRGACATSPVATGGSISSSRFAGSGAAGAAA